MTQRVELTPQEARLIVRALFALGDESKFTMADRINRKLAKVFTPKNQPKYDSATPEDAWICDNREF